MMNLYKGNCHNSVNTFSMSTAAKADLPEQKLAKTVRFDQTVNVRIFYVEPGNNLRPTPRVSSGKKDSPGN